MTDIFEGARLYVIDMKLCCVWFATELAGTHGNTCLGNRQILIFSFHMIMELTKSILFFLFILGVGLTAYTDTSKR